MQQPALKKLTKMYIFEKKNIPNIRQIEFEKNFDVTMKIVT